MLSNIFSHLAPELSRHPTRTLRSIPTSFLHPLLPPHMPRSGTRPKRTIRKILNRRTNRGISVSDKGALIYGFREGSFWKIGRTINLDRRMREWKRSCPNIQRRLIFAIWVPNANRTGEYRVFYLLMTIN